jgi:hypothetical protein
MVVWPVMIKFLAAQPAEVSVAARAGHFVAAVDFLTGCFAFRALSH